MTPFSLADPCSVDPCGENSVCDVERPELGPMSFVTEPAFAVCSCEEGYENTGPSDEEFSCTPIEGGSRM